MWDVEEHSPRTFFGSTTWLQRVAFNLQRGDKFCGLLTQLFFTYIIAYPICSQRDSSLNSARQVIVTNTGLRSNDICCTQRRRFPTPASVLAGKNSNETAVRPLASVSWRRSIMRVDVSIKKKLNRRFYYVCTPFFFISAENIYTTKNSEPTRSTPALWDEGVYRSGKAETTTVMCLHYVAINTIF